MNKKNVQRNSVMVVPNKYGGAYHINSSLNLLVNIEQVEMWCEDGLTNRLKKGMSGLGASNDVLKVLSEIKTMQQLSTIINNWSKYSDVDIHILVDFNQFSEVEKPLYEELFYLKKSLYNEIKSYIRETYDTYKYKKHANSNYKYFLRYLEGTYYAEDVIISRAAKLMSPMYYAISEDGKIGYGWFCRSTYSSDCSDDFGAFKATEYCKEYSGKKCFIFAYRDEIVWNNLNIRVKEFDFVKNIKLLSIAKHQN